MNLRILLLTIFILMTGCITVELCDDSYDSELVVRFKTEKEGETVDSTVSALTLYGIREGQSDSLLYDSIPSSGFVVPLDPHHDYSRFVLQIDTLMDTLTVYHEHEVYMISYTCGFASMFTLDQLELAGSVIQNDTIINEMVDAEYEDNEIHIWLYL